MRRSRPARILYKARPLPAGFLLAKILASLREVQEKFNLTYL